jgi:hypothetical protein
LAYVEFEAHGEKQQRDAQVGERGQLRNPLSAQSGEDETCGEEPNQRRQSQ